MSAQAAQTGTQRVPQKVLRIGVVQEGKVARERLMRTQELVTVGDGPRATFPVLGTQIGANHELFVPRGDHYVLSVPEWVEGKLSWKDGIRGLDELRARGEAQKKGELWHLILSENVKGKVTIGTTTILFQFVQAPPEPVRPISPADFRRPMLDDEDPLFLGLLGVFSVIAVAFMLYVYTTPRVENEAVPDLDELSKLMKTEPIPIEVKVVEDKPGEDKKVVKDESKPKPAETSGAKPESAPSTESVAKKSLLLQMFGTVANGEGTAADLIGDDAAQAALDAALNGVSGAQQASAGDLGIKTGGKGGRGDASVGVGVATGGTAGTGTGAAVVVKKPKVDYGAADATVDEGEAGGIPSAMRKSAARIATCVEQGLKQDANLSGRVSVGFQVTKGKISDVHLVDNTTRNDGVGTCIVGAVRSVRFAEDLTATVAEYPFVVSGQ